MLPNAVWADKALYWSQLAENIILRPPTKKCIHYSKLYNFGRNKVVTLATIIFDTDNSGTTTKRLINQEEYIWYIELGYTEH